MPKLLRKNQQSKKDKINKKENKLLSKRNNKKENKSVNKIKKIEGSKSNKKNFLVEQLPYYFTPSYIKHNGLYATIVKLYVRPGSNRNLSFNEIIDFIPTSTMQDVKLHLLVDDIIIKYDEKKKIIRKNAPLNKATLENTDKEEGHKKTDTQSAKEARLADYEDYNDYERIIEKSEPIVVFKWSLLIVGPSQEIVEEQLSIINLGLDQRHEGAKWDSLPGLQEKSFTGMFSELEANRFENTSTGSNYAGLNLAVNAGLNDPHGQPIGYDALALTMTTAYFDFERSTFKQAIIAIPRSAYLSNYSDENQVDQPSVASIAAQAAANQFMLEGHRVHHIVLNDFNYFESGQFYRSQNIENVFKYYDVNKLTINPLQGFGDIEKVTEVYDRLVNKIVNIFDLMQNLKMQPEDKGIILKVIESFYLEHDLWRTDADVNPRLTRIVDIDRPDTYPTLGNLINEFTSLARSAAENNRELKADRIETLESLLSQSLTTYTSVLGRTTSIESTNAPQVYYQFNNIGTMQLKQIQFVNLIEYISYNAKRNDVVIIHGYDQVLTQVSEMVLSTIDAAKSRGVRFIFAFDSIKSRETKDGKTNDMFEMQNKYYVDLDTDVDWSIIGKVLPEELTLVKKVLNQELGLTVEQQLMAKTSSQVLVHRRRGGINNFIDFNPLI